MANTNTKSTTRVNQIFNDLDKYRDFCRDYGFVFNEADLYNPRVYSFRQFQKALAGKPVPSQWEVDYARWKEREILGNGNYN